MVRLVSSAGRIVNNPANENEDNPMVWLDRLSWKLLLGATILLGLAPLFPQPHLWEKLNMLVSGQLHRPIDIFDLLMHSSPLVLVMLKLWRQRQRPMEPPAAE